MSTFSLPIGQRLRLRENQIFLALTILIGILAGLAAVLFTIAIKETTHLLFGVSPSHLRTILVPAVVSLFTGFLLAKYFPDCRGSGVPADGSGVPSSATVTSRLVFPSESS